MGFRAFRVRLEVDGTVVRGMEEMEFDALPLHEVLIKVDYSSLNYKDALSASGNKGVTRVYPHTPGIDAAGEVVESVDRRFRPGDKVIVTSYDLGMNTDGGFAEYVRVPADWVVPLPEGLDTREAMILGTAGFTAGMSVAGLLAEVPITAGKILVTGATGGVGSLSAAILAHLGYSVVAASGKPDGQEFLARLGVEDVIHRDEFLEGGDRPLMKARWAGGVDTVGGQMLEVLIKSTLPRGVVTCCGNVASADLALNVYPFILRGVSLKGIDSQNCPMENRKQVWDRLGSDWKVPMLSELVREVELEAVEEEIRAILEGRQKGRVLIRIGG